MPFRTQSSMLRFSKMHAAKNDFLVINAVDQPNLALGQIAIDLADRHAAVGFDQMMVLVRCAEADSGFGYLVYNADGSSAQQCGNGARALATWVTRQLGLNPPFQLKAPTAMIDVLADPDFGLGVRLNRPNFVPSSLPMRLESQALSYQLELTSETIVFCAVSLGNPHITIVVDNLSGTDVEGIGYELQSHPAFPERINVGFCQVFSRDSIGLRVFERGAGETFACGSGACAAVVNMISLGLCDQIVRVQMPGGELAVQWPATDAQVCLFGAAQQIFEGAIPMRENWLRPP
jgi:diaminopimelate epimerase